jgi:hypothetical protein
MLAETLLLANRPEAVFRVVEDALAITQQGKQRHTEPELWRLQGEAARALGNPKQAATFFRQGIDRARSMGARLLELRCALALTRLVGGSEERAELRSILDGFVEGQDQPDFKQACALLDARDPGRERPATPAV